MALTHSTEEMFQNLEYATNYGGRLSGRADALVHVGKLLTGEYTPEQLETIHLSTLSDPEDADNAAYLVGYKEAWDVLFNLVYGKQPNELHKQLGPIVKTD
jgi:hypothetical protein